MPTERLTMRNIREVLRLRFDFKLSYNKIAQSCQMGRSTVCDYIQRFDKSQLTCHCQMASMTLSWSGCFFSNPKALAPAHGPGDRPLLLTWGRTLRSSCI